MVQGLLEGVGSRAVFKKGGMSMYWVDALFGYAMLVVLILAGGILGVMGVLVWLGELIHRNSRKEKARVAAFRAHSQRIMEMTEGQEKLPHESGDDFLLDRYSNGVTVDGGNTIRTSDGQVIPLPDEALSNKSRERRAAETATESATLAKQTKTCVYCAEDIKVAAIRCKHCGSFLPDV